MLPQFQHSSPWFRNHLCVSQESWPTNLAASPNRPTENKRRKLTGFVDDPPEFSGCLLAPEVHRCFSAIFSPGWLAGQPKTDSNTNPVVLERTANEAHTECAHCIIWFTRIACCDAKSGNMAHFLLLLLHSEWTVLLTTVLAFYSKCCATSGATLRGLCELGVKPEADHFQYLHLWNTSFCKLKHWLCLFSLHFSGKKHPGKSYEGRKRNWKLSKLRLNWWSVSLFPFLRTEKKKSQCFHFEQRNSKKKLEMLGGIVTRLGSVNPQHVCSLCKFIFTCLQS